MIQVSIAVRRAFVIAACLAVSACSPVPGSPQSSVPGAVPSDTAPRSSSPSAEVASTSLVPRPASTPTASAPAKPTGVTFTTDSVELPGPSGTDEVTYQFTHTVTWEAPRAEGVEIRVYGVTECPSKPSSPAPGTSGPCLEDDTEPPPSVRVLAVTAPAAAGEVSWVAPFGYDCAGPPVGPEGFDYDAIVVAAYNAAGESTYAIADAGSWTRADPGEVIC